MDENIINLTYKDRKGALLKVYPYIVAWGQSLRSFGYYIEDQVSKAIIDEAPKDAIYYNDSTEKWEVVPEHHKADLDRYINGEAGGLIPHWYERDEDIPDNLKPLYANN